MCWIISFILKMSCLFGICSLLYLFKLSAGGMVLGLWLFRDVFREMYNKYILMVFVTWSNSCGQNISTFLSLLPFSRFFHLHIRWNLRLVGLPTFLHAFQNMSWRRFVCSFSILLFHVVNHYLSFLSVLQFTNRQGCIEDKVWKKFFAKNKIQQTAFPCTAFAF